MASHCTTVENRRVRLACDGFAYSCGDWQGSTPGGPIRVWGSPTWQQLDAATETALLRFRSAEARQRRLSRGSNLRQVSTTASNSDDLQAEQEAATACQVRLRKAEYLLTLALRNVYKSSSPDDQQNLRQRAMDVFREHANSDALLRVGTLRQAKFLEQMIAAQVRYESDRSVWKSWADARVRLGRAESWVRSIKQQQRVSQSKLDVLARLGDSTD